MSAVQRMLLNRKSWLGILVVLSGLTGFSLEAQEAVDGKTVEIRLTDTDGAIIPHGSIQVRKAGGSAWGAANVLTGEFVRDASYGVYFKADAQGILKLRYPEGATRFTFSVITPGYGPYWADWEGIQPTEFTAVLDKAWTVGGVLVDEAGAPIANAEVHPSIEYKKRPGNEFQLAMGNTTRTDDQGRWTFASVPIGLTEVSVRFTHSDFMPLQQTLVRTEYEVLPEAQPTAKTVLGKGVTITGTVTDAAGKPVAGATVKTSQLNSERETKTNAAGQYTLTGGVPGRARLVVATPGMALTFQDVQIEKKPKSVDFQLQPGEKVRIRVLDHAGKPLEKARIFFQDWSAAPGRNSHVQYFEFDHVNQYTNAEGVWEWLECPAEGFRADIAPGDRGMMVEEMPFTPREEEYVVKLFPPLIIKAQVIDAETKAPVPAFRYIPGLHFDENNFHLDRDDGVDGQNGQFTTAPNRALFGHAVRVEAPGYRGENSRLIKSDEGEITLTFELRKAIDVFGKILTADGDPARGAKVALGVTETRVRVINGEIDDQNTNAARTVTDDSGRFRFPAPGSEFQLYVTHPEGYAMVESKNEEADKAIVLSRWASVRGVLQQGDQVQPNIRLSLDVFGWRQFKAEGGPNTNSEFETTTNAQGEFEFPRVLPGRATIGQALSFRADIGAPPNISVKRVQVDLESGQQSQVTIGGTGRTVVIPLLPPAVHVGEFPWKFASIGLLKLGPENEDTSISFWGTTAADGTLTLRDVDPGEYRLSVYMINGLGAGLNGHDITVPDGDAAAPVLLEKVELQQ